MQKIDTAQVSVQTLQLFFRQLAIPGLTIQYEQPDAAFDAWALRWLSAYKKGKVKSNTYYNNYADPIRLHIIPYFGHTAIHAIRPIDVQEFFNRLESKLALESMKKIKACLFSVFETAKENGLCSINPVSKRVKVSSLVPPQAKHTWTQAEYDTAYSFARAAPDFLDILVLMETAITRSELLGLTWDDFDAEHQLLHIRDGLVQVKNPDSQRIELVHAGLKNRYRRRTIPLSAELTEQIGDKPRTIYVGGSKKAGTAPRPISPKYIFHSPHGGAYSPTNWHRRVFLPFMQELIANFPEIPELSPHELRHTRATLLNSAGVDIYSIARLLGHCDLDMLSKRYLHDDIDALRKSLRV